MQMQGLYRISYVCLHKQTCFFCPLLTVPNLQGSSERVDWNVPFSKRWGSGHINKPRPVISCYYSYICPACSKSPFTGREQAEQEAESLNTHKKNRREVMNEYSRQFFCFPASLWKAQPWPQPTTAESALKAVKQRVSASPQSNFTSAAVTQ